MAGSSALGFVRHPGGAEDFVEMRRWGTVNRAFLQRFLPFAEGVPSHDTLNDIVNALYGDLFSACLCSEAGAAT